MQHAATARTVDNENGRNVRHHGLDTWAVRVYD